MLKVDPKLLLVAILQLLTIDRMRSAELPTAKAEEVVVTAQGDLEPLTSPSNDAATEEGKGVPGGFNIRNAADMERGRASNFQDLLDRTPGLLLQTANGTEVSKVSIRGSGILSEDEPLGVQFMLDGMTLNQGDGEAILEDFDLATIKYAEVFRGANATRYGSTTLGGAINLVTMTGREADPVRVRLEGGSFGYFRSQLSSGGSDGPLDYIASLMDRSRDGYRDHSAENTERFFGDIGYRFSETTENRLYITLDRTERALPGGLTKQGMNDDPRRADPDAIDQDFNKKWDLIRLADKMTFKDPTTEIDAGLFWFHRNLEERGFFKPDFRQGITAFYSDNYGLTLNLVTHSDLWGRRNIFTAGFSPQWEREVSQNFENLSGHRGQTTARGTSISITAPFYFEDQHYLTERLSAVSAIQLIYAQRHFRDEFLNDDEGDQSHEQNFFGWNPKVGLIYEVNNQTQIFTNFSGSWQPPSFDSMVEFADGTNSSVIYTPLQPQRAWTLELGTRGRSGPVEWDLALYHSWLRNELLELNDAHGNDIGAVNVPRSYHQGIEVGLDLDLLEFFRQEKTQEGHNQLMFSQTYTLNDFHFDDDPVYGHNRIAGLPMHVYETQLLYTHPLGFYAGPNLRCNLTRYPVDQANTIFADAYAIPGFEVGYRRKKGLSVFFEAKNLADKHFASAVDPIADARRSPEPRVFHPGDGRSFYGGVSWSW